jgi:hypothetical protein
MGCRLNDLAGIATGVNTVPEAIWASSPRHAFQGDAAPTVFHTQGANSIFVAFGRDESRSVFN